MICRENWYREAVSERELSLLVKKYQGGDQAAFEEILQTYRRLNQPVSWEFLQKVSVNEFWEIPAISLPEVNEHGETTWKDTDGKILQTTKPPPRKVRLFEAVHRNIERRMSGHWDLNTSGKVWMKRLLDRPNDPAVWGVMPEGREFLDEYDRFTYPENPGPEYFQDMIDQARVFLRAHGPIAYENTCWYTPEGAEMSPRETMDIIVKADPWVL